MSMSSILGRCPEFLTLTVLPGGVGLGCLRDPAALLAVTDRLDILAPQFSLTSYEVPSTSLEDFARWLVAKAELAELADSEVLGSSIVPSSGGLSDTEPSWIHSTPALAELPGDSGQLAGEPSMRWRVSIPVLIAAAVLLIGAGLPWTNTSVEYFTVWSVISDVSQLLAAVAAAVLCWRTSRLGQDRMRQSWLGMAIGCGGWAAGQLAWTYLDIIDKGNIPYPSVADIGFILFPIGALFCFLSLSPGIGQRILSLTAVALVACFVAIYWSIAASSYSTPATGWGAILNIYYPVTDLALVSLAFISVSAPTSYRVPLSLLALGAGFIGIADALFTSSQSNGLIAGHIQDAMWVLGFVLIGAGGLAGEHLGKANELIRVVPIPTQPPAAKVVTYLPLAVAGVIVAVRSISGHPVGVVVPIMLMVAVVALLILQYLQVRENHALLARIQDRETQLLRQAFRDPSTGLPNKALFVDRLTHALRLHRRDARPLGLILCGLYVFAPEPSTQAALPGDQTVQRAVERLRAVLATGDTLARFGEATFAVLLESDDPVDAVVYRLRGAMAEPFASTQPPTRVTLTMGWIEVAAMDPTPTADDLIARAYQAMTKDGFLADRSPGSPAQELKKSESLP